MINLFCLVAGLVLGWKMVKVERAGWMQIIYFLLLFVFSGLSVSVENTALNGLDMGMMILCGSTIISYSFYRLTGWINSGPKIVNANREEKRERPVQINVMNVRNEHQTTINIVHVNYNVSLNVLGVEPGFGKRELKRARKEKLGIVKQERKKIGWFDKDGKIENRNKVERIEQSYKNLLEHVK